MVGTSDDKPRPGKFTTRRNAIGPLQLKRDVITRVGVDQIPPQLNPEADEFPSDDRKGNDRIPSRKIPDNEKIPSEKRTALNLFRKIVKSRTMGLACSTELKRSFYTTRKAIKSQLPSVSRLKRCTLSIVSSTQVQVRT